ncbi:putative TIR domain, P-loop containing nucleoside triphosphate hydrolase [Helianthus annuus]|nr:putative TIR domain, P-loop containing nucleoside triphosphate hydrolase [Helianthus annuus]
MASTSVSSVQKSFKYDVFLSFRGTDTRKGFVDHLYHALHHRGIIVYKDNVIIEKGERINDQLIKAIAESRYYIIVFSKNYASSSWCLKELEKIMECQKMAEHTAYPVFYDVEPTEVRNQSGAVGEAFANLVAELVAKGKHENGSSVFSFLKQFTRKRKRTLEDVDLEKEDDVGRWRNALKEAADLAGMELKNTVDGHEAEFIKKLVKDISVKLHFINLSVDEKLVGIKTRVMDVVKCLETDFDDVQMIGIKGIGGGGKTTLARAVFDHMSVGFEGKSFVENVRDVPKGFGLKEFQKQVLKDVLNDQSIDVTSVSDGEYKMKKMMRGRKVLLVLDDVDHKDQLEALAGDHNWFKSGSKIIITTRDEQVLKAHQVNFIHDVNLFSDEEAICLFSRCAFKTEIPIQGYQELSRKVETLEKLELSYNGLEDDHKEIFLHVACMLKGELKDEAIRILESFGFHAEIGLRVLEQKSLITISDTEGLGLHARIEEMGRNIVRRLHPQKWLWNEEEIKDILVRDLGTEATRSIKLNYIYLQPVIIMNGLKKMKKLRFLSVHDEFYGHGEFFGWHIIDKDSHYLPESLQYLHWPFYGIRCLPKTFRADNLVNLRMVRSSICQLWEGGERKVLNKLKFLDLKFSKLRTLDLRLTPVLERLDIRGCNEFVEIHMPIECPKLKFLSLGGSKLSNLKLGSTPHLETLDLAGCYDFVDLYMPFGCPKLKFLNLSGSQLSNFDIGLAPSIVELYLDECNEFVELHMPVACLNLKFLNLSGSKLANFDLGLTPHLERLDLRGCSNFVELHMPCQCPNLRFLFLSGSKLTTFNLELTPHLETLDLERCFEFVEIHLPIICPKLKVLNVSGSKLRNLNIGLTPNLVELYLEQCNDFVELHMPVACQNLKFLNLSGSKLSNLNIGLAPSLERLDLNQCKYLQEIQAIVGCLKKLVYLNLSGCSRFKCLSVNSGFGLSRVDSLAKLQLIAVSLEICPLHPNNNSRKFQFECSYDEPLPLSSGNLEKLLSFGLCACTNLESFSENICGLQHLGELTLEGSVPEVLNGLHQLQSLEELTLSMKEIKYLPDSICTLKRLKSLELKSCLLLEQLPKDLDRLVCLEKLQLTDCESLQEIPDSICMMKRLKHLHLPYSAVEKLPEELGRLEFLKELDIEGTSITHLPQSIFQLKGLRIVWSRGMLEEYRFTPLVTISRYTAAYYIRDGDLEELRRTHRI